MKAKKDTISSPPLTSPSNQNSKKFEEEIAKSIDLSKKELKKGDKEELLQLKRVLKESLHKEIKKTFEQTSTSEQPKELKEQMNAIKSLLSDLNQDREAVKRIVDAITAYNER